MNTDESFNQMASFAKKITDLNKAEDEFKTLMNSKVVQRNQWLFATIFSNSDDELDDKIQEAINIKMKYKKN